MAKFTNDTKSRKSKAGTQPTEKQLKFKEYPRSYRLDSDTLSTLKGTLDRVNGISPKRVSEARLVKALIALSTEIDTEKLLKYSKEVW